MSSQHEYDDDVKERVDSVASPIDLQGAKIEETIYNPELKAAIENTNLDPWSRRAISLYFICMVGFLNAVSSGTYPRLLLRPCGNLSCALSSDPLSQQVSMARSWAVSTPCPSTRTTLATKRSAPAQVSVCILIIL